MIFYNNNENDLFYKKLRLRHPFGNYQILIDIYF